MGVPFRFDAEAHSYIALDTGEELPHITGMLQRTGWIDDRWFTEESCERGTAVHQLTADYDLEALDLPTVVSGWKGYLLGYAQTMAPAKPEHLAVEVPAVHPRWRYGGRPDRVLRLFGALGVLEIKSGGEDDSHAIQTALQAMLVADQYKLPARAFTRWAIYVKPNGRAVIRQHKDPADFDEALSIIKRTC